MADFGLPPRRQDTASNLYTYAIRICLPSFVKMLFMGFLDEGAELKGEEMGFLSFR